MLTTHLIFFFFNLTADFTVRYGRAEAFDTQLYTAEALDNQLYTAEAFDE